MNSEHKEYSSDLELEMNSGEQIRADSDLANAAGVKAKEQRKQFFYWLRFVLFWLIIGILFSQFVLQRNTVYGESMVPTLYSLDELLVEKVTRFFGGISRGDIVTCRSHLGNSEQNTNIVKRVIGLPGE
ncbi:MAG TPA: signal peptidase I, partial [Clostridiaceae bacterium]|nr:signal peptidase I [Clostridiaceae bacterium]